MDTVVAPDRRTERPDLRGSRGVDGNDDDSDFPDKPDASSPGLKIWLPFDGDGSDHASDRYQAVLIGPQYVTDRLGEPRSAIRFDGVDDYAVIVHGDELKSLPISVSFWVQLGQIEQTSGVLATSVEANTNSGVFFAFDSFTGAPSLSIGNGLPTGTSSRRTLHSDVVLDVGEWVHIAGIVQYVGAIPTMTLLINGEYPANPRFSGSTTDIDIDHGHGDFMLGRRYAAYNGPALHFQGSLDDVAVYDRVLTLEEVRQLYRGEIPR